MNEHSWALRAMTTDGWRKALSSSQLCLQRCLLVVGLEAALHVLPEVLTTFLLGEDSGPVCSLLFPQPL